MFLWSLVFAQFALGALLVLSAHWRPFPWLAVFIASPGIGMAVWAWTTMGLRKVRVHPSPTDSTRLITSGPYAIVRHPMYSGLLWFTAALLLSDFVWWRLLAWVALAIVLAIKSQIEERKMASAFVGYTEYRKNVSRLLPGLW